MGNVIHKICVVFLLCVMQSLACHADTFKGKIVNAETGEIIIGANIQSEVNPQPGWSIQNSAATDSTGCFRLTSEWEGRIMFTFSMIGFRNSRKVDYSYGKEVKDTIDLGTIKLQPTALMLQEVEVTAKVPRITMSGDTIVFNPEAFKLKDGARLDELIRKLPGVENRNGKLFWNNKPIRLTMNGKDLFGGDQIVSQLPAEVAQKLKLYDRKSELARHTGKDDGDEDHVLDIQVKPGFLDKWYGNLSAQYQTKDRYMFELQASKLSDHDPQMVYAQANNANRYIDRTMQSSMNRNIDGDGKSQYGSYNYQHNWKTRGAEKFSNNRFDVSANLGHSDGWSTDRESTETFFPGKERTFDVSNQYHHTHRITPQFQARLFAYADSANTVSISAKTTFEKLRNTIDSRRASYGYEPNQFEYHTLDAAFTAKPGDALYDRLITRNHNYQSEDKLTRTLTVDYSWKHFFGKKGSFSISGNTKLSGANSDTHTNRKLEYLRDNQAQTMWQYSDALNHTLSSTLGAALDYWLGKKLYVNISDNITYSRNRQARDLFADTDEHLLHDNVPTTLDRDNSLAMLMHSWTNRLALKATINPTKALMIMPKLNWTMQRDKADNYRYGLLDTAAVRTSQMIEPSMFLKWKMSRVRNMDLSFAYNTTVPSLVNTFGFRNTINPLMVSTGNPLLRNTHSHTTSYNYHRMWLRKQIVLGLGASYTKDINPMATLYRYNSMTGAYESMPMNVKGGDEWKFNFNYDQGLGVYFRVMNKLSLSKAQSYGFLTIVDNGDAAAKPSLNHQKLFGVNEDFQFTYELEKFQLEIFNRLEYNRYRYDDATYNTNPLFNSFGFGAHLDVGKFTFYLRLWDDFRSGYKTSQMNGHKLMSMGYVNYHFFKNKCWLMLYVDDIFNKDTSYDSEYSAYKRTESSSDWLHHYAMLKLTYRFDAKAKKK